MNLRELIEDVDVPDTRVAEGTWERARGRVRRRRLVTTGAAGLAVATVAVAVSLMPGGQRADGPTRLDSPTPTAGPAEMVVTVPDWGRSSSTGALPTADADPLSENPVDRASLVMADPDDDAGAFVLGDDGDWRRLDVQGLQPVRNGIHIRALVRSTSLDETATRLAIPQPDGLFVVDLTTGDAERYDVPGQHTYAIWHDASHVLVAGEPGATGTLVDLDTAGIEPLGVRAVDPRAARRIGADLGRWDSRCAGTTVRSSRRPTTPAASSRNRHWCPVKATWWSACTAWVGPSSEPDSTLVTHNGVVAVDGDDGAVLGSSSSTRARATPPPCSAGPATCPSSAWSARRTTPSRLASSRGTTARRAAPARRAAHLVRRLGRRPLIGSCA